MGAAGCSTFGCGIGCVGGTGIGIGSLEGIACPEPAEGVIFSSINSFNLFIWSTVALRSFFIEELVSLILSFKVSNEIGCGAEFISGIAGGVG